jgi:hypothetical protein
VLMIASATTSAPVATHSHHLARPWIWPAVRSVVSSTGPCCHEPPRMETEESRLAFR